MEIIERYRRSLRRRNCSAYTIKNYVNRIEHFTSWMRVPLKDVTRAGIGAYIDHLRKTGRTPTTIVSHLHTIHLLFDYLIEEEMIPMENPVRRIRIRLPKPLPRYLKDDEVERLFSVITDLRDRAIFTLMLRSGLRVEEVAHLTCDAVEYRKRQIFVANGKGAKDRVVYLSDDARVALEAYMAQRTSKTKALFLVQKGPLTGTRISVRGIQKRIEYYSHKAGLPASCHRLRHTFATQLLNADADLASIQDLLGHEHITTTQRYCRVANTKVRHDYHKAMELVLQKTQDKERPVGRRDIHLAEEHDATERRRGWRVVQRTTRN
ncbi:MAG TPA: tyrosine-type recombinase/integrase [Syntrophorhabdales bacterium]|nr:tyrosine-type recombinase/integrase [Syntrophorhabdales bacterium]